VCAGYAVALVVHPHVVLGDPDQAIGLVRPLVALAAAALLHRIARLGLDIGERGPARQRLDLRGVVAQRDQLLLAPEHLLEDIAGVADRARVAGDAEFLRRYRLDAGACVAASGFDRDVVEQGIARCEQRIAISRFAVRTFTIRYFAIRYSLFRMFHDLDAGI